jgi:hypothetical protein
MTHKLSNSELDSVSGGQCVQCPVGVLFVGEGGQVQYSLTGACSSGGGNHGNGYGEDSRDCHPPGPA